MDYQIETVSELGVIQIRTRRMENGRAMLHRFVVTPDHDLSQNFPTAPNESGALPDYVKRSCELFFANEDVKRSWAETKSRVDNDGEGG